MPLFRRLPKRGFNNAAFKTYYAVVNVGLLEERFEDGATIDEAALRQAGIVKGRYDGVKILGDGELKKKFTVSVCRVSGSAKAKIEGAGGSVTEPPAATEAKAPEAKPKAAPKAAAAPAPAAAEEPKAEADVEAAPEAGEETDSE